jgi:hypothetical protein
VTYNPDLWRTEELHKFRAKGMLSGHGQVVIGNAGLAAKYNPLPSILESLLDRPCSENLQLVRFSLATHFVKVGICRGLDSVDVANDVIAWFLDPHCHACHGTGVKNKEQETCQICGGVAKIPEWEPARKGCAEVGNLFAWREVQLRKRNIA